MKLAYVDLCGFRGYRKRLRLEFGERFTIIDGRNGAGKSTIFDAVEFALTGSIGKYGEAKAAGETIADYLWWTGSGPTPEDRFVEVGFRGEHGEFSLRRTQLEAPDAASVERAMELLCDVRVAPKSPLDQLCVTAIIRDEQIASLSLDLKETDRYAKLRDALGAIDADVWITRAAHVVASAKRRVAVAQQDVAAANAEIAAASRRIDEIRAGLVSEAVIAEAVERLRQFSGTAAPPDELSRPVRERIATLSAQAEAIGDLLGRWANATAEKSRLGSLLEAVETTAREREAAAADLGATQPEEPEEISSSSSLVAEARDLITLVDIGRRVGLHDGGCPLCGRSQSDSDYAEGMASAELRARRLDEGAAQLAERENVRRAAAERLVRAERAAEAAKLAHERAAKVVAEFERQRSACGLDADATVEAASTRQAQIRKRVSDVASDLWIVETMNLGGELERAQRAESDAKARLARVQERLGMARRAESIAQELHDAARRAAGETLDRRLERVLPLLSELYQRLHPHPLWRDIEYSIRGDVKRFLRLQVGENLNPQFLFSSGQRRATGLAFLLSINLALAWSRWRSILLDDPVQHVDDFRTVHLAEVLAQCLGEGRQIICAVEDVALADLMCRRLPIGAPGEAKWVTLGADADGALANLKERDLLPLIGQSLVATEERVAG